MEWAINIMRVHATRKSVLELQFEGEEVCTPLSRVCVERDNRLTTRIAKGTGLGPSLEFYSLVAAELQRKSLCMWVASDENTAQHREIDLGGGGGSNQHLLSL